jgi:hypothetical protein
MVCVTQSGPANGCQVGVTCKLFRPVHCRRMCQAVVLLTFGKSGGIKAIF